MAHDDAGRRSPIAVATAVGVLVVLILGGACGVLGYRVLQGRAADRQRAQFVDVARQAAASLTSIDYRHAEVDVQRILEMSTGAFRDDFAGRSDSLVGVVTATQSISSGSVTEAGLESMTGGEGRALVAVTVMSSNRGVPEPQPRYWRMRLTLNKIGQDIKVSQVDFQ